MATEETELQPDPTPPTPTWENAAAVETPPDTAEPATLQTDTPLLPVDEPVRKSETEVQPPVKEPEEDKDVEEDDTPEILALPTGSSSRKWARRQFKDAAPTRIFDDLDKPIQSFGDELYKRSESRYFELVDEVINYHKDLVAQRLFGAKTFDELKSRLQPNVTPAAPATVGTTAITLPTADQLNQMTNEDIAALFPQVQESAAKTREEALRAEFASQFGELKSQLDAVTGKQTETQQQAFKARASEEKNKLYDKVWSTVVDGGIRDSGLEVSVDDLPRIANLKRAAARILKAESEPAFDADESNRKLIKTVVGFADRGEFQNAWREEDNLTVRARAAFASVKDSAEVKQIMDEIEAYAKSTATTRADPNPKPPAPGSATGVSIKPPTTWDEAIAAPRVLSA